jgi:uncharacterized protein (DUF1697 family)
MALIVFMRGVNVGGHRAFRPSVLAGELADLRVVNVGAAGTFVVRGKIGQATLRAELLRRLPFEAELMICRGQELIDLAGGELFQDKPAEKDAQRFVSVMAKRPQKLPALPVRQPAGDEWQVKIVAVSGQFALSLWRRLGRTLVYPNEVVEKQLGVPATTRNWNTVTAVCDILKRGSG